MRRTTDKGKAEAAKDSPESIEVLIAQMDLQRIALRASKTKVVLLALSSLGCSSVIFANFAGWTPYTPGLTPLMAATAYTGFVLAIAEIQESVSNGRTDLYS